ncbi:type I-E CRISPR-associated protein Cas6/Cse3/CasE [Ferrovum sp.]|uniref:type I-E CRISPR-associated protein Cas6/Cse3/CasE n=1 Tax=Ferrovum sp. TaxID=2609467 RepID=UPI0026187E86|nr:type I-E CRISPR-associated protein Cas6/Cse3/CasE [Ferrovum sp.]
MKYLARVQIHPMSGPYKAHQTVYEACQGLVKVWRRLEGNHAIAVTDTPPIPPPQGVAFKSYDPSPVNGSRLRFDLLVESSATEGKPVNGGRNPRVDPVLKARIRSGGKDRWNDLAFEYGAKWLKKREERLGAKFSIDFAEYDVIEFIRGKESIRLGTIAMKGILTVTDSEKLKFAMENGVGHGKAWGCGLLLCNRI